MSTADLKDIPSRLLPTDSYRQNEAPELESVRLLVVGDVMLDRYWFGDVSRISPEAPVPVVRIERREERLGGAANVARNAAALGAHSGLLGVVGADEAGTQVESLLRDSSIHSYLKRDEAISTIIITADTTTITTTTGATTTPSHSVKVRTTAASCQSLQSSSAYEIGTQPDLRTPLLISTKFTIFSLAFFSGAGFPLPPLAVYPSMRILGQNSLCFLSCGLRWPHSQKALRRVKSRCEVPLIWVGLNGWDGTFGGEQYPICGLARRENRRKTSED